MLNRHFWQHLKLHKDLLLKIEIDKIKYYSFSSFKRTMNLKNISSNYLNRGGKKISPKIIVYECSSAWRIKRFIYFKWVSIEITIIHNCVGIKCSLGETQ